MVGRSVDETIIFLRALLADRILAILFLPSLADRVKTTGFNDHVYTIVERLFSRVLLSQSVAGQSFMPTFLLRRLADQN